MEMVINMPQILHKCWNKRERDLDYLDSKANGVSQLSTECEDEFGRLVDDTIVF